MVRPAAQPKWDAGDVDEQQDNGRDVRQSGCMVDSRGVQPGREGRDERGADRQREQGDEHAGSLGPEQLSRRGAPPAEEGRPEHEEQGAEYRADQGGLDHGGETGAERENGYQQLGQVADARLEQARRARAQALTDLLDATRPRALRGTARAQAETMKRATSGALAAAITPEAAVKMPAPAIARRCEVPRASVVLGMSSTSADVTATSGATLYSEFPA